MLTQGLKYATGVTVHVEVIGRTASYDMISADFLRLP